MSTLELPHYEVLEKIGSGGMGEVYRGRDIRIDRAVALKRLPPELSLDPERLSRLEREARLLASLHHPNIAMLYGVEEAAGTKVLVLEFVEGETIAERLERGPLDLQEGLKVARHVARGLEAAHDQDIVHRDLKPANVMIDTNGEVKILDFGLAKVTASSSDDGLTQSPTLSYAATRMGTILGTPAYMSPEQVRGQALDSRTDIWSFGCLIYECLTGVRPFAGETPGDQLAAILSTEPDWQRLPKGTSPRFQELLERCLAKEAQQRWRDIGDVRLELERLLYHGDSGGASHGPRKRWQRLGWAALFLLLIFFTALNLSRQPELISFSPPRPPVRFTLDIPDEQQRWLWWGPAVTVDPQGERMVYVGYEDATSHLFQRRFGELESQAIPGTERGSNPRLSPDGRWLLFSHPQGLNRLLLDGDNSTPQKVSAHDGKNGAAWTSDGRIVSDGGWGHGLVVIDADGNEESLTHVREGETLHMWPDVLPDDQGVLFTVWSAERSFDESAIAVVRHDSSSHEILPNLQGSSPRYLRTPSGGYLLWVHGGALLAAPFNANSLQVSSELTVPLVDGILTTAASGAGHYAVSPAHGGTLVHLPGDLRMDLARLIWIDEDRHRKRFSEELRAFAGPSIAHDRDELRFAVVIRSHLNQIDVYDEGWEVPRRVVSGVDAIAMTLKPDGQTVTFDVGEGERYIPHNLPVDGSGEATALLNNEPPTDHAHVESWSSDGTQLAYTAHKVGETVHDVYVVSPETQEHLPLLHSPDNEQSPRFSPDDQWIAYRRNKIGERSEIWVKEIQGTRHLRVSEEGEDATYPRWSAEGRVFYLSGQEIKVVGVLRDGELSPTRPQVFYEPFYSQADDWLSPYDVAPDGRLLAVEIDSDSAAKTIQVTMNWFEEVQQRFATQRRDVR